MTITLKMDSRAIAEFQEMEIESEFEEAPALGLLYIEPKGPRSEEALVDSLTRRMTAAWRKREALGRGWMGVHDCCCRAYSDNDDHLVGGGTFMTNSLCVHYLAYHRNEIPQRELKAVAGLPNEEANPTTEELERGFSQEPPSVLSSFLDFD